MNITNDEREFKFCGVYLIRNKKNNKVYIGSTVKTIHRRLISHLYLLNKNKHGNSYLQRAWNKYGEELFNFEILEVFNDCSKAIDREKYWIEYYKSYNDEQGYNIIKDPTKPSGYKHTVEMLKYFSNIRKGRKSHPNTIVAILKANTGKKHTEERNKNISLRNTGIKRTKETCEKISFSRKNIILSNKRKIIMLNNNFEILNIFSSLEECSKFINMSTSNIRGICNGRVIQRKEYILLYEYYPIKTIKTDRKFNIRWNKKVES